MKNRTNRPVLKTISRDNIAALPDNQLTWALWDYIWLRVGKNHKNLSHILATLPQGFHLIYHLFVLDGEIANGGFNQYFFNVVDENAERQSEALKLIGARKHLQIFRKAFHLHDKEKENQELQRLYVERTLQSFSITYKKTSLGKYDEEWYALNDVFEELMVKFIRRHIELFLEPEQD